MKKIKLFRTKYEGFGTTKKRYDIDEQINEFISSSDNIDVIDIKFNSDFSESYVYDVALLIYNEIPVRKPYEKHPESAEEE